MRMLLSLLLLFSLVSGCIESKPLLITKVPVVFIPDAQYFYCPVVEEFPDPETLIDEQLADLIVMLDTYNRDCRDSLDAVWAQLITARTRLEQTK